MDIFKHVPQSLMSCHVPAACLALAKTNHRPSKSAVELITVIIILNSIYAKNVAYYTWPHAA